MTFVDGIASTLLPTDDRGLQYGDGVFETIAIRDGEAQHWERHLARLASGAQRLGMACPTPAHWQTDLHAALAAVAPTQRRVAKLLLTRGSGGRGYAPPLQAQPRRVVYLSDWPAWPASHATQGITLCLCTTPVSRNRTLAGLKHLNRLEQVLGAAEVAAVGADEGLMFDDRGDLVEGTRSNVFIAVDGELLTPLLDESGVAGIMRDLILEHAAAAGLRVRTTRISRTLLAAASEVFVCNSLLGVWPVRAITGTDGRQFADWPLTSRVVDALRAQQALP